MKILIKKSTILLTVTLALLTLIGAVFSVGAVLPEAKEDFDKVGYGTYEEGVVRSNTEYKSYYYPAIDGDGHPNLDFEQGLKYWICGGERPTDRVTLNKDSDGNSYITIKTENEYSGIKSVKFACSKLEPGETPGVLYKWRAKQHAMQIVLDEYYNMDNEENNIEVKYIAHQSGYKGIWSADEDDPEDWNIALTLPDRAILPSETENKNIYYTVSVETTNVPEAYIGTDIDDIQVVKCDMATGIISDLDGKVLYNLNNLPKRETVDYDFQDADDKDPAANKKFDIQAVLSGKAQLTSATGNSESDNTVGIIILISAIAVVILCAAAVLFFAVKKKKARQSLEDNSITEE